MSNTPRAACTSNDSPHAGRVVNGTCAACKSRAFLRAMMPSHHPSTEYKPLERQPAPATAPTPRLVMPYDDANHHNSEVRRITMPEVATRTPTQPSPPTIPQDTPTSANGADMVHCGGTCQRWLPRERFYRHSRSKTGLQYQCKDCQDQAVLRSAQNVKQLKTRVHELEQELDQALGENERLSARLERLEEREARLVQGLS